MSEEEKKTQSDLIRDAVKKEMRSHHVIDLTKAIMLIGIFLSIAIPIYDKVYDVNKDASTLKAEVAEKASIDFVTEHYLTKGGYHILQKREHESDLDAIRNPNNADLIYMKQNSREAETLELVTRGSERDNKPKL